MWVVSGGGDLTFVQIAIHPSETLTLPVPKQLYNTQENLASKVISQW
jgi:hypothetical protein